MNLRRKMATAKVFFRRKRTVAQREVARRWGLQTAKPVMDGLPPQPTEFERKVADLGLLNASDSQMTACEPLRRWVSKHAAQKYVPEWLLAAWGIDQRKVLSD